MEWKRIQAPLGTGALSRARSRIWRTFAALLLLTASLAPAQGSSSARNYSGFDANEYPGDASLPALRRQFAFTGYWLNNPPGASHNAWIGKRALLVKNGFGFLVLFNGRLNKDILASQKRGTRPEAFGQADAALAVAAARREGFPPGAILFLDQEEGGRMFPEQAANPQKPGVTAHAVKGAAPGKRAASGGPKNERSASLAVPAAAGRTAPPNKKGR